MNAIHPIGAGARCLVLGAGGFIGLNLCEGLRQVGAEVRGFGHRPAFPHALSGVRMTVADLGDTSALAAALAGVDVVFHLLGGSFPARAEADPARDLRCHAAASVDLLALCRDSGVRQVVFVSSGGTVYGVPRCMPIDEDHPTDPISAYGIHQLLVEKHLGLLTHRHGVQTVALRVANPFGPYQRPGRGQGLVATLIERRLRGLPVEIWGDGRVVRDFFHVADLVDAALAAAAYRGPERVLNVGSGIGRSVREVVGAIDTMLGLEDAQIVHRAGREVDVRENVLDIARIRRVLGWAPRIDWMEGLRDAADWIRLEWLAHDNPAPARLPAPAGNLP